MERRGILLVAALVALSGCVGFATGSEPLNVSSDPVGVEDGALEAAGYERAGGGVQQVNQTVEFANQERRVKAELHVATYVETPENANETANLTAVTLVSAPGVEVAGVSIDPLSVLPEDFVFTLIEQRVGEFDGAELGTREVTMLGNETTATRYRLSSGEGRPVNVERVSVTHEGDLVIALVAYPEGTEPGNADRLLSGVSHPA
jgi:hypothetical protein